MSLETRMSAMAVVQAPSLKVSEQGWLCILTSRLTAHGAPLIHWLTLGARRLLTGRRGTLAAVPRYYALRLARRIVCWKRGRGRSPEQRDKESKTHGVLKLRYLPILEKVE